MRPGSDQGTAQVVVFMVAGVIFMAAVSAVLLASQSTARDTSAQTDAARTVQAEDLAAVLVDSPGIGWAAGPDHLTRLGLAGTNGSGLRQSSIDALRGALAQSSANGKVDYDDAQRSLGIDPAGPQEFHVRIYPVAMDSLYDSSLSGLRTAYVGDWASLASLTLPLGTPNAQMATQANVNLNLTMFSQTVNERRALDAAGIDFNDRVYITVGYPTILVDLPFPVPDTPILTVLNVPLIEGDVYPDNKQYLDSTLANRLGQYQLLVVGSGVDQSSMTSSVTKYAIRDWVLAGGTLVVLGSNSQNYQWLQPLFSVGVATVNGAPSAPDVAHPLLMQPNVLAWTSYDTHGLGWDIKSSGSGAHYNDFSHVITQGGEDVLAISKEGGFGAGRIVLTTFLPREFAVTLGQTEAEHFFENVILYADHTNLYLEYGPSMPDNMPVSVAVRDSWLWDTKLGVVPVRIEVHLWG